MGGQQGLGPRPAARFSKMLVRVDEPAAGVDLNTRGEEFTCPTARTAVPPGVGQGQTSGGGRVRLPVPGGYMDLDATDPGVSPIVPAGAQIMIHPSRADLNYEILKDTYISVNGVEARTFSAAITRANPPLKATPMFEVVGNLIAYCENNNATGSGQSLAALKKPTSITTEADRHAAWKTAWRWPPTCSASRSWTNRND